MSTNPLMARFAGEPALVEASMTERFESCLQQAAAHPDFAKIEAECASAGDDDFWSQESWTRHYRPYVVKDGILQIPVKGVLLHDFPFALGGWATGYEYIWEAFKRGCGDYATGAIKGIALVCHTPGGMVAGCFETADRMVALKEELGVPVRGFAHEAAYSAGYAIISTADHVVVSRTGGVGSIGVVTSHVDASGALDKMGLKITFIHAGKHKVDGNPTQPLPDDVKARIQSRIDELYDVFVASVSRNRSMDEQAVRATEALTFTATQAVSNGLADSIGPFDEAMAAFAVDLDAPSEPQGEESMAEAKQTVDQAVHEKAVTDARAEGHAAGVKEGAAAAQTRISAILSSDEAKGREAQANHIAFKTDMSAETAIEMLAASAKVEAPKGDGKPNAQTPFDAAMADGNPNVGGETGKDGGEANGGQSDVLASLKSLGVLNA